MNALTPQQLAEMKRELGRSLADFRNAQCPKITQENLARALDYSRSTIANAETGNQVPPRKFWEKADDHLCAGDALVAGYDHLQQTNTAYQMRQAARRRTDGRAADWTTLLPQQTAAAAVARSELQAPNDVETLILDAVDVIEERLGRYEGGTDLEIIASLGDDARVIARSNRAPVDTFREAHTVADRAERIARRALRPTHLTDLYTAIGQMHAIMASAAFDLGQWSASDRIAHAATNYASMAGHQSLQAWALGLRASSANWRGDPDGALALLDRAQRLAPAGEPMLRVRSIKARSYALLGDLNALVDVLADVQAANGDTDRDELSHSIGGEFAFGSARAAACLATACLDAGLGPDVELWVARALEAMAALSPARRSPSQLAGAQIDLASGHLLSGNLDDALEVLEPVIAAALAQNTSIAGRLTRVQQLLSQPKLQREPKARVTIDAIAGQLIDAEGKDH